MLSALRSFGTAERQRAFTAERLALYALAVPGGAALILSGLLVTHRTSLAPDIYLMTAGAWLVGSYASALWEGRKGAPMGPVFNPLMLFFALVAATYTIQAIDAVPPKPIAFNPNQPDDLPGLHTAFTPYYLAFLGASVLFISWYGRRKERELETGLATVIAFTSLAFEHMLRAAGNEHEPAVGALSIPLLWAPLLVLFFMWRTNRDDAHGWRWTPLGGPLLAFVAAGIISTAFAVYPHASLLMLLRISAFSALTMLIANTVTSPRQVWLYGLAIAGPLIAASLVIVIKLFEIQDNLGTDFVLSLRYQISGVAGTNPAGLSLGIAILLATGGMIVHTARWLRGALAIALVLLAPAFLSTHSPSGLVALIAALGGVAVFRFGYETWSAGPKRIALVGSGAVVVVALLGLLTILPNPYTGKVSGDVTDPTTGRSVRGLVWSLAGESFRDNPLTGVGLQNYYARTNHVDDVPSVEATRVGERRLLLQGTGEPWKPYITSHPHNAYLAILETMGLPGLVALLWIAFGLASIAIVLFLRASGTFWWWASTLALAGAGMALAWNVVAQGEDVTMIALPFWPLLGLCLGAFANFAPEQANSKLLTRLPSISARTMSRALIAVALLAFLGLVGRPVAAEILVQESDEAADVDNPRSLHMMRWASRLSPLSADYHRRLGNAHLRNGSLSDALREQGEVLDVREAFAPDYARLGWLHWFARDLDSAYDAFARAVALDRWDTTRGDVHIGLGLVLAAIDNYEGARDALAYGLAISPSSLDDKAWIVDDSVSPPRTYLDPSYLQSVEQGLPADLQRNLLRRLGLPSRRPVLGSPSSRNDYSLQAILERMQDDYDQLLASDSDQAEALLATMGQIALQAELPDLALEYYTDLAARQPDDERAQYGLGLALVAAGDNERAVEAFTAVLSLSSDESTYVLREPFSHFELGRIALESQPPDLAKALEELREARDGYRWSYMPNLYPYLAIAEALSGNGGSAKAALDKELYLLDVDGRR